MDEKTKTHGEYMANLLFFKTWQGETPAEPNAHTDAAQQEFRPPAKRHG